MQNVILDNDQIVVLFADDQVFFNLDQLVGQIAAQMQDNIEKAGGFEALTRIEQAYAAGQREVLHHIQNSIPALLMERDAEAITNITDVTDLFGE